MVYKEHIRGKTQRISQNVLSFLIDEAQLGTVVPFFVNILSPKCRCIIMFFIWEF